MTKSDSLHKHELRKLLLCLLSALIFLLLVASYAFKYLSQQYAKDFVESYLAKYHLDLGFEDPSNAAGLALIERLNSQNWNQFELTTKDINLLLASKLKWQERFYVIEIKDNLLRILVSWPLINGEPDSYLAGQALLRLVFSSGLVHFELVDFLFEGKPVPPALLVNIPVEILLLRMLEDSESRAIIDFIKSLSSIRLNQNRIVLERRAAYVTEINE